MDLKVLKDNANKMIKKLVDELGLNGDTYVSLGKCSMIFGPIYNPGKFYTAESEELKEFLADKKFDSDTKKHFYENGLIVISDEYMDMPMDPDLIITFIHEKLHSNRMLLAELPYNEDKDVEGYFYDDGHFITNSNETEAKFIDASQDILLDSIDDTKDKVDSYSQLIKDNMDKEEHRLNNLDSIDSKLRNIINESDSKQGEKLEYQMYIDEALVELMAITAYRLSTDKNTTIMDIIKRLSEIDSQKDIQSMARIILRHNDLELLRWMIDPITYQGENINYDYFSHYINDDDMDDVKEIIAYGQSQIDNDAIDKIALEFAAMEDMHKKSK